SDCMAPACTVALAGHTPSSIAGGAKEQPASPAFSGAPVVTLFLVTSTSALSWRPASSVTVTRTAETPQEGMTSEAVAVSAFCSVSGAPPALLQAYWVMLCPAIAALPVALSCTVWPLAGPGGSTTAAIGRSAAASAPEALAMPAPQVLLSPVQMHS